MKNRILGLLLIGLIALVQSCGINSNLLLKTPKDYVYETMDIDSANQSKSEYIIGVDDILTFKFYTNNGQRVLDIVSGEAGGAQGQVLGASNTMKYTIMNDSLVKLPALGQVNLVGKSIQEAELFLQEAYKSIYVDPFVQISVTNNRVLVFPGSGGLAQVVYLTNNNTTLLEVIALAGGITERGRASKIKLIREEEGERKVYLIDLSTIEGLQYTDLIVQNGDYVYVEPVPELGKELLKEIAPIFTIITSTASTVFIILSLQ
jgi:polysaccharide export outer membrane protein